MSRYLNPRNDLVFKKIFGQHAHLLVSFLSSLLSLPADALIASLDYVPTEQVPHIPILKRTIIRKLTRTGAAELNDCESC